MMKHWFMHPFKQSSGAIDIGTENEGEVLKVLLYIIPSVTIPRMSTELERLENLV